jgi:hypothetical protein
MRVHLAPRFLRDERGATLPMAAVMVLLGIAIASLAVDMGYLYTMRGKVQTTADAAALAGAGQIPNMSNIREEALALARQNLPEDANGAVVTSDNVTMGNWNGSTRVYTRSGTPTNAVEVIALRTAENDNAVELFFARVFGLDEIDIEASAIVQRRDVSGCVVALDPSADGALTISGNAEVNLDCGALVNSNSATAIIENGSACLNATSIATSGDYSGDCLNPTPEVGMPSITDPLADLDPPDYSGCDFSSLVEVTVNTTLLPGVYCGGIDIHENAEVQFAPGTYILDGVGLQITGNSIVTGDEVIFYFPPTTTGVKTGGGKHATTNTILIAGTTDVTLRAPTSGYYEGILFYQDRDAPSSMRNLLTGTANMLLEGLFYFPNTEVKFAGNSSVEGSDWIAIIARTVEFVGTTDLFQDLSEVAYSPSAAFVSLHIVD